MPSAGTAGADEWMGTDVIQFRSRGGGTDERVVVLINGVELSELWQAAGQNPAVPLRTADVGMDLEAWSPFGEVPSGSEADGIPTGYVPVLTCTCGTFGCGGALARITFERGTVTWSDFATATYEDPVDLGPFRFRRTVYEAALRAY